jgi:predicted adenine nucleotide alpha hydrolase (AANH) superfamily ATPase
MLHPYTVLKENFDVTLFFYNPNIYPEEEYKKRLNEVKRAAGFYEIALIAGRYENKKWLNKTIALKDETEGGCRCTLCFEIRLNKTAKFTAANGFDSFASALSVSPHKNAELINEIGRSLALKYGVSYLSSNFKKSDGFKKTMQLSGQLNIYRQKYCGCIYSMKKPAGKL